MKFIRLNEINKIRQSFLYIWNKIFTFSWQFRINRKIRRKVRLTKSVTDIQKICFYQYNGKVTRVTYFGKFPFIWLAIYYVYFYNLYRLFVVPFICLQVSLKPRTINHFHHLRPIVRPNVTKYSKSPPKHKYFWVHTCIRTLRTFWVHLSTYRYM